jgi:phage tail sheath gpL-like
MATSAVVLASLSADDKVPGVYQENKFGQGASSIANVPRYVVVTGNKLSTGSVTADSWVGPVYSMAEADTYFGAGSEIWLQCEAALETGAQVIAAPVAEAGGAVAATLVVAHTSLGTGTGQISLTVGDEDLSYVVGANASDTADNLVAAAGAKSRLFASATKGAGPGYDVTFTVRSKGIRGNNWLARVDLSQAPSGASVTLTGDTPVNGWTPFSGGTGTDDASNVITLLKAGSYFRIAAAQNDATNAGRWEAHVDAESDPLIEHLEQVVFGHNGTLAAATSLARSTLNSYLCQLVWCRNCRKHPAQIAARFAGLRQVAESNDPWTRYDGKFNDPFSILWTNVPQQTADIPLHSEQKAALNDGVTPVSTFGGDLRVVRSICSHSRNGSAPDYRCLDTADVSVPQRFREELGALSSTFIENNPGCGPDLPDGSSPPPGTGTPRVFKSLVTSLARDFESRSWLSKVTENPPQSWWNEDNRRIETAAPNYVTPHQHQLVNSVRQIAR